MDQSPEFINEHVPSFLPNFILESHAPLAVICDAIVEKTDQASMWPTSTRVTSNIAVKVEMLRLLCTKSKL